jgi:alkanesulfonate monooxygenase SsuD/methylene tetrahydromethanopterin reductase-like flavin-dependent oxidoreductase (luciferase family)
MIKRARAANDAKLDSLFVGDHHIVPSPYYQNTPMLGRLLAEWGENPAGALFLLPLWNPVLVAEQTATLACITKGPFILQCGLGTGKRQFSAMGTNIRNRPSAFEQSIDTLRALWQGETVSLDGRWKFSNASICPLPPTPIDIWIGASADIAIERAAKMGDAWLADPSQTLQQAEASMETYQRALQKHGKVVPDTVAIRKDIYVAENETEANEVKQEIVSSGYRGFNPEALVIGDVDMVLDQFQDLGKLGYTDIITRNLQSDPEKAVESIGRLARVRSML